LSQNFRKSAKIKQVIMLLKFTDLTSLTLQIGYLQAHNMMSLSHLTTLVRQNGFYRIFT